MKIPRTPRGYPAALKVKDQEYRVAFVDAIEGKNMLGLCDQGNRVIFIKTKESPENTYKTFLHEVLHALCFEHNIKVSHRAIYQLEEAVFQLLKDNQIIG